MGYMGMGIVAEALGHVPSAITYLEQARTMQRQCQPPNRRNQILLLINLGDSYLRSGRVAQAGPPFRQGWALMDASIEPRTRLNLLDLLGILQLEEHHPDSAIATWRQELREARAAQEPRFTTFALGNLAGALLGQGRPAEALPYAQQAQAQARAAGDPGQLTDYTRTLADILHALHRPEAYDTLQRFVALHDTLTGQARSEAVAQAQARFDVTDQKARVRALEQQRRIQRLEADQQAVRTRLITASAAALAVLLLGAAVLYLRLRRTSAALAVSEAQARAAEAEARRAVATKDQLMSIIGHDLRSPVATF